MKYQEKSFMVPYTSKEYRDNWSNIFSKTSHLKVGDLVAVKEYGGFWATDKSGESQWYEDEEPSFWYGVIGDIVDKSKFKDKDLVILIDFFSAESGRKNWEWVSKKDVCLITHNIESKLRKELNSDTGQKTISSEDKSK